MNPNCTCVMVLGTTSGAGKSTVATALCRHYAGLGYRVAPFKAKNISTHARVVHRYGTEEWGEIGASQYTQARAAGCVPDTRMNPVLLKPEANKCDVIIDGEVRTKAFEGLQWSEWGPLLWEHGRRALHSLSNDFDVIVIEGMGSPAEINLGPDYANMVVAEEAGARCILVVDIEQGGAFAHLLGTYMFISEKHRPLIKGFLINRFRGEGADASILQSGIDALLSRTGVPTIGTLPLMISDRERIPDEDLHSFVRRHRAMPQTSSRGGVCLCPASHRKLRIAVVAFPDMSNSDEFHPLVRLAATCCSFGGAPAQAPTFCGSQFSLVECPEDLRGMDIVILPGAKNSISALKWLNERRFPAVIHELAAAQSAVVIGVCGGAQILGIRVTEGDQHHAGIGLLDIETNLLDAEPADLPFGCKKVVRQISATFDGTFSNGAVRGAKSMLTNLEGLSVNGYEIHRGRSSVILDDEGRGNTRCILRSDASAEPVGWLRGSVMGTYVHGLFENDAICTALIGRCPTPPEAAFDALAAALSRNACVAPLAARIG